MRKTIWTGTCTAIMGLATAVIFAQSTTPQQSPTPQQSSAPSSDRVTITGCLKAAPGSSDTASAAGTTGAATAGTTGTTGTTGATGTAGAAGASASTADTANTKFVLTDATVGSAAAADSPAATAPGAPAAAPSPSAASSSPKQTFNLVANPTALAPHVGKKLELTGTLENQSSASQGAVPSETTTASNAKTPSLRVESGKVIAATCSEQ